MPPYPYLYEPEPWDVNRYQAMPEIPGFSGIFGELAGQIGPQMEQASQERNRIRTEQQALINWEPSGGQMLGAAALPFLTGLVLGGGNSTGLAAGLKGGLDASGMLYKTQMAQAAKQGEFLDQEADRANKQLDWLQSRGSALDAASLSAASNFAQGAYPNTDPYNQKITDEIRVRNSNREMLDPRIQKMFGSYVENSTGEPFGDAPVTVEQARLATLIGGETRRAETQKWVLNGTIPKNLPQQISQPVAMALTTQENMGPIIEAIKRAKADPRLPKGKLAEFTTRDLLSYIPTDQQQLAMDWLDFTYMTVGTAMQGRQLSDKEGATIQNFVAGRGALAANELQDRLEYLMRTANNAAASAAVVGLSQGGYAMNTKQMVDNWLTLMSPENRKIYEAKLAQVASPYMPQEGPGAPGGGPTMSPTPMPTSTPDLQAQVRQQKMQELEQKQKQLEQLLISRGLLPGPSPTPGGVQ